MFIECVADCGTGEFRTVDVADELDAVCLAVVAMTHRNQIDALEFVAVAMLAVHLIRTRTKCTCDAS